MTTAELHELSAKPKTRVQRAAMALQCALLRRNWAGPLGEVCMVMQHRGRRTGAYYETPVAFLRDGERLLAVSSHQMRANWVANALHASEVDVVIHGQTERFEIRELLSREDIGAAYDAFRERHKGFERAFKVDREASQSAHDAARERMRHFELVPVKELPAAIAVRADGELVHVEVRRLPERAEVEAFVSELEQLARDRSAPLAIVLDGRSGVRLPRPLSALVKEACERGALGEHLKGEAIVVSSTLQARIARLALRVANPSIRMTATADPGHAARWARRVAT